MSRLDIGDILEGRYRVDQPIARGGMSTVYRCVDLRLGRAVAAKVMHDHFATDPIFVHRFQREALAMAQLTHPNLVGVYDFNAESEPIYLVMELITGGTLRELLGERGPMPPHAATAVMRAMLTGLSVVHAKGLVHRDIKPDNVLISADHRVKLGDFGLVRSSTSNTVTSNNIVGTVSYLSPEQVDGSDITTASDVYSAGIVLFELLTGTLPFSGETDLAHALARLNGDVAAPSSRIAGVPHLFDELVASATTRDVNERFADAGEFLAALDDVAAELALPAFTVPVPKNSAAARTAAKPTDMTGIGATDIFAPTSIINPSREPKEDSTPAAAVDADANARAGSQQAHPEAPTEDLSPTEELLFRRAPLSFETQAQQRWPEPEPARHTPRAENPPAAAPSPTPATPPVTPLANPPARNAPAERGPAGEGRGELQPRRDKTPTPPMLTNRSGAGFAVFLLVVTLLAAAVAIGGWSYASGMYGMLPQFLEQAQ